MKLRAKILDIDTGGVHKVLLNAGDVARLAIAPGGRVLLRYRQAETVAIAESTQDFVETGNVGIVREVQRELGVTTNKNLEVTGDIRPTSAQAIRKKMEGMALSQEEMRAVVEDLISGRLAEIDVAAFLTAEQIMGLSLEETVSLARSIAETGQRLDFGDQVFDKHSIGGVPGNKVSLLVVPIAAAAGLVIPKTSSRAITSATGTADTMEVLAQVEFSASELRRIVRKVGAAIVWMGALNLAPADDLFLRVEQPLHINPRPQLVASIIAEKLATGVRHLVLDIPMGEGCKVSTMEEARKLSHDFVHVGTELGIDVHCAVTYGSQPVGHTIGPALEAREALEALSGRGPPSLIEKSTGLAGLLLEMSGRANRGDGRQMAKQILASGKALEKLRQIIEAQNGNPKVVAKDIPVGEYKYDLLAPSDGYVATLSNRALVRMARAAGTPKFHGAGIYLHAKIGTCVKKDDPVLTVYSESEGRLTDAIQIAQTVMPFTVEGMILQSLTETEQYRSP